MGKLMLDGVAVGLPERNTAGGVSYDNTQSGLSATEVQSAIDEVADKIPYIIVKRFILINCTWTASQKGLYYSIVDPLSNYTGKKFLSCCLGDFGGMRTSDVVQCRWDSTSGLMLTSNTNSFAASTTYTDVVIMLMNE